MYFRFLVFAFIFTITIAGAAVAQVLPVDAAEPKGYLVGPGDEITGKVLGETQFDFVATVDENGKIEVPFFETPINAKCLTERDLRTEITRLLAKYLKSPQLSLRVTQRNSRPPVSIYGEVRQQQQFNLTRRAYLLELITIAGGESEKSGGMVTVVRTRPPMCGETTQANEWKVASDGGLGAPSRTYSMTSLKQGQEGANPEVFPGDVIIVSKAAAVYVTGEVIKPGELGIPEGGLPLTQAIAMASGMSRDAKKKEVMVYRRKEGETKPEVIAVNYDQIRKGLQSDMVLQPLDIVVVGKSKKSFADIMLEVVTGLPNRIPLPF